MKVYLVRHAESEGNKTQTYQFPETGLSENGRRQALILAKRLTKVPIDLIYTSSLLRAQETSEIIAGTNKVKIETWQEIREIGRPSSLRGTQVKSEESRKFEKAEEENYSKSDWKYSDDESFNELVARGKKVLNHLLKNHQKQNVLLVSHGTFIKILVALVVFGEKLNALTFWEFRHHSFATNTGISICQYTEERGWKLLSWNDTGHL